MSGDRPRVTVVLTAYQQSAYLPAALAGLDAQTHRDWDVVLADDASTDGSADLLRGWAAACDRPATLVLHEHNTGLTSMLNEVLPLVGGEHLAYLGGDDVWAPAKLARLVDALDRRPEVALAYSDARMVDADGVELAPSFLARHGHVPGPDGDLFRLLLQRNPVIASSAVFRTEAVVAAGGWDPELPFEDWDLLLRLAEHHPIAHVPEVLVDYRVHDASATRSRFSVMLDGRMSVLEKWLGRDPADDAVILAYLRAQSWRLFKVHPDRGRRHVAVAYAGDRSVRGWLRRAVATRPAAEFGFEVARRLTRPVRALGPRLRVGRAAAYR